jgi:Tfp pilus assembly protein PilN
VKAVNLIPSEQRSGNATAIGVSNAPALMVVGLLVGVAVLAFLYGSASHQVSSRKAEVANVNAQAQATQARASELAPYVSFKQMYQQRLQDVSELVGTRFDWAHAFHELGRVLPSGASLSAVHGAVGSSTGSNSSSSSSSTAGAVASATPAGTVPTLALSGCATSQSEVALVLQRLRLMDGVSAVTLQSSSKGASSGGSSSSGCPAHDPVFAATVTFAALPNPPAIPAATATASDTEASSGSTAPAATPAPSTSNSTSSSGAKAPQ